MQTYTTRDAIDTVTHYGIEHGCGSLLDTLESMHQSNQRGELTDTERRAFRTVMAEFAELFAPV